MRSSCFLLCLVLTRQLLPSALWAATSLKEGGKKRGNSLRLVVGSTTPPACLKQATVSHGRDRASVKKQRAQCAVSKFASGQSHTSSRQGVLVCGALRLPHDLISLPLLFPQNSLRDFCGNPERQESICSPLTQGRLKCGKVSSKSP